ncbi:O-antigen ligase family protein [Lysinibacillus sp. NPDC097214]|uniref:O-antigen ligase family protein n=1 Tax=Lysinibacillus sp. NPDC097214 TaxID=3390584 RepID=UPI003D04AA6F
MLVTLRSGCEATGKRPTERKSTPSYGAEPLKGDTMKYLTNEGYIENVEDVVRVDKILRFLIYIYIVISFYEAYINQLIGSYTKYYLLFIIVIYFSSYSKIKLEKYHLLIISWLIFKFASILWGSYNSIGSSNVSTQLLSQVGMVGFFLVMTIVKFEYSFVKKIIDISLYASVSMGFLSLFFSEAYLFAFESRQVLTLFGTQNDPNNMAAFFLVGISIALYYIIFEKEHIFRNCIFIVMNGFALSLTASRGGFVSLVVVIVLIVFVTNKRKLYFVDIMKKIILIVMIIVSLFIVLKQFLPVSIFDRLFSFDSYKGGSGREDLWTTAATLIEKKPFFGWGWGGYESGLHNTYLTMLCDVGIVGFSLFLLALFSICIRSIKFRMPLGIILLVTGLGPSFFIDAINKRFFWNALILAIMLLNSHKPHK